jgi:hypothetical protein
MKRRILIILALVGTALCTLAAANPRLPYNTLQQMIAFFEGRNNTFTGTNTFTGSVAIPATDPSRIANLESGTSLYAINGSGTISTFNRIYTLDLDTSPILKLDALTDVNVWVVFKDLRSAGNDSGVSIWSPTDQIGSGVGASRASGSTIFHTTGNSLFQTSLKAVRKAGVLTWEVWSSSADAIRRP